MKTDLRNPPKLGHKNQLSFSMLWFKRHSIARDSECGEGCFILHWCLYNAQCLLLRHHETQHIPTDPPGVKSSPCNFIDLKAGRDCWPSAKQKPQKIYGRNRTHIQSSSLQCFILSSLSLALYYKQTSSPLQTNATRTGWHGRALRRTRWHLLD